MLARGTKGWGKRLIRLSALGSRLSAFGRTAPSLYKVGTRLGELGGFGAAARLPGAPDLLVGLSPDGPTGAAVVGVDHHESADDLRGFVAPLEFGGHLTRGARADVATLARFQVA